MRAPEAKSIIFADRPRILIQNASVAAAEVLREGILSGQLRPGQRLKEEELAKELGISRTPVREALLILQAEGLVESVPNRGAVVRTFLAKDIAEMYEIRALLEGHGARIATGQMEEATTKKLAESCDRLAAMDDVTDLVRENFFFHNTILETARSGRLIAMVRMVTEVPLVYRSYFWYSSEQRRASVHYHRQLVRAFERREAERAEAIMREHILEACDVLVSHSPGASTKGPSQLTPAVPRPPARRDPVGT